MARRPRSLALSFTTGMLEEEGPILRTEVLTALVEAGIPKAEIEGIEAPRKNLYYVVFKTFLCRRTNIGKSIRIREKYVKMAHPDPSVYRSQKKRVKIYNYPLDEDIDHLEKTLKHYGNFNKSGIKDLEDRACGIKNGIKEVYVEIKKKIPSYVYIGKNLVGFNYMGQDPTCRKCHQTGHIGRECTVGVTCRGCGGDDHYIATCPNVICFQCGKQGHTATSCFSYDDEFPDINEEKKEEERESDENGNNEPNTDFLNLTWNDLDHNEEPEMEVENDNKNEEKGETNEGNGNEEGKVEEEQNKTKESENKEDRENEEPKSKENSEEKGEEKENEEEEREEEKKTEESQKEKDTGKGKETEENFKEPKTTQEESPTEEMEITKTEEGKEKTGETSESDTDGGEWTTVDGRKKKRKRGDKKISANGTTNPSKKRF